MLVTYQRKYYKNFKMYYAYNRSIVNCELQVTEKSGAMVQWSGAVTGMVCVVIDRHLSSHNFSLKVACFELMFISGRCLLSISIHLM